VALDACRASTVERTGTVSEPSNPHDLEVSMRRTSTVVALMIGVALLGGCGSDAPAAAEPSTSAPSPVDPDEYADQIIDVFRSTYATEQAAGDDEYEAVTADWSAFVAVIEDLEPPAGEEADHARMVAGFEAYADARKEASSVCAESPGPGGPCFTAVSAANDQWQAALERAYELPDLSWETLLG
jgi:hypothetical protein